ncbi:uracil-DNA glycosylase [Rhizobium leguminosarum]|uniref:uracil-DNA glycosylase n=1 Tax=Rhizobium leguminosarum TaxID=384 RepID=UPI001C958DD3|nr:uracil-DNA glycosylase [Rhizobium leguminosarum]MBY5414175.1 uracil-DNA glycosylase [Rhizobium leguminosarum]
MLVKSPKEFVEVLGALRFPDVFNPYADKCPDYDLVDAVAIRRRNLELVVAAAIDSGVNTMWIARDLGYRGGRRTGLALTDEIHLADHASMMNINQLQRATGGPLSAERTAQVIWQILNAIKQPVFLWNVFPLHPHASDDVMTNRAHTRPEASACKFLLEWLMEKLRPSKVMAVGRDAQNALEQLGFNALPVRHPSYGGQVEFLSSMRTYYNLPDSRNLEGQRQINLFD